MNKKLKWILTIFGFIFIVISTFVLITGTIILINLIQGIKTFTEKFIIKILEIIPIE